ncbi:MAG: ABC transporter permease [gamma proteobacterium symbiont of Taylorina sp.]|nr:ABC transporter permease [gamma proteobacterium symbiont of Taylorina sp.]
MNDLSLATQQAVILLFKADPQIWEIIFLSFSVSLRAILLAAPPAILIAFYLSYFKFPGRHFLISLFNTAMAIPAVVVGLTLYLLLSRSGPLGDLQLLFTQDAMIIGQIILCFPLLVALSHAALYAMDRRAWETAITLGSHPARAFFTVLKEARFGLTAAIIAAFGRIIAEVGSSMMIGGNILHYTRNIPTAIALETSKGSFAQGIALGIILLLMALMLNLILSWIQSRSGAHHD